MEFDGEKKPMVNMPSSETRILPGESGLPGTRRWSDAQRSTALKGEKRNKRIAYT